MISELSLLFDRSWREDLAMIQEISLASQPRGPLVAKRCLETAGVEPVGYDEKSDGTFSVFVDAGDVLRAIRILKLAGFVMNPN